MESLVLRPAGNYLHTANWQELFLLCENWLSNLQFDQTELQFLEDLVNKYFIAIIDQSGVQEMKHIAEKITSLNEQLLAITESVKKHQSDLSLLMESVATKEEEWFRSEHHKLEVRLLQFSKDLRALKVEIFAVSEKALRSEKVQHLLK